MLFIHAICGKKEYNSITADSRFPQHCACYKYFDRKYVHKYQKKETVVTACNASCQDIREMQVLR